MFVTVKVNFICWIFRNILAKTLLSTKSQWSEIKLRKWKRLWWKTSTLWLNVKKKLVIEEEKSEKSLLTLSQTLSFYQLHYSLFCTICIALLVEKTNQMNTESMNFKEKSVKVKRKMWWKNFKLMIVIIVLLIVHCRFFLFSLLWLLTLKIKFSFSTWFHFHMICSLVLDFGMVDCIINLWIYFPKMYFTTPSTYAITISIICVYIKYQYIHWFVLFLLLGVSGGSPPPPPPPPPQWVEEKLLSRDVMNCRNFWSDCVLL